MRAMNALPRLDDDAFPPTLDAARARIAAVRPADYARSRNALDGAVSRLSPYVTHGFVTLPEVLEGVRAGHRLAHDHKFVYELGWREYFHHVWTHRGEGILRSLRDGPLPERAYARELPDDILRGATGVPAVDMAVRTLYATGWLHNHARMWLASYVVHLRKVHWRAGAEWMWAQLLDGDLASNHLSWQWVAGTASAKPYLFNAENVARYAPRAWHSPRSVIDQDYEELERIARTPTARGPAGVVQAGHVAPTDGGAHPAPVSAFAPGVKPPPFLAAPPADLGFTAPDEAAVAGRDVWLVHPWSLGALPDDLPPGTIALAVLPADWHRKRPWSEARWRFVGTRMAELAQVRWLADAAVLGRALRAARSVEAIVDPHLDAAWTLLLPPGARRRPVARLFVPVERVCGSFSQWWSRTRLARD